MQTTIPKTDARSGNCRAAPSLVDATADRPGVASPVRWSGIRFESLGIRPTATVAA